MLFESLQNYTKRMKFIAPIYSIAEKLSRDTRYNMFDMMNITFSVLCYLQYSTLSNDEGCYLEDIGEFINELLVSYYETTISSEQSIEIADYIVRDVLQAKGSMLTAEIIDFDKGQIETFTFILVESNLKFSKSDKRNRYRLTHEAMEILFRTDEVDSVMLMNLKTLILKKTLEGSNYDKALKQIIELVNISKVLYSKVESLLNRMKVRVYEISIKEVKELQESLNQQFDEQYYKFKNILDIVDKRKKEINTKLNYNEEKKLEDDIRKLDMIKAKLNIIIEEYSKLLNLKQDIYTTYTNELLAAIESGYKTGLDFNKIRNEFESNIITSKNVIKLFNPLFKPYIKKRFNIDAFFQPQNIYYENLVKEDKKDNLILGDSDILVSNKLIEIERINSIYESGLALILNYILSSNNLEITLEELVKKAKEKNDVDYSELVLKRDFYEMLLSIYRSKNNPLNLKECYEEFCQYEEKSILNFNAVSVVGKVFIKDKNLRSIATLKIEKYGDTIIKVEDKFMINNLVFKGGV